MSASLAWTRAARLAAALLFCSVVMLACAGAAFAITTYTNATPAPNTTTAVVNPPIKVKATDPAGINASSLQFKLDGVTKTARFSSGTVTYQPPSLKNGTHTAWCSLLNYAGQRTPYQWSFTVAVNPVLGPLAPADGQSVSSQSPEISAVVSPNGVALSSWSMLLDGAPVPATYDVFTKRLSYTPPTPLQNDENHTATLSVTDATGLTSQVTWTFSVQIYADMINSAVCVDCHWDYPAVHTMANCDSCHGYDGPVGGFYGSPDYHPEGEASQFLNDCTSCHNGTYPTVPMHGDLAVAHRTASDMSGCACHVRSLSIEHNRWTLESGAPIACTSCHGQNADQVVKDALVSGQTQCLACHTISPEHPYGEVDHVADVGETVEPTGGFLCSDCHEMDLSTEHAKSSSSSTGDECATCHPRPRESLGPWSQTCAQGGCHAASSPTAVHGNETAAHAFAELNESCLASGCHGGPTDLAAMHSEAATTTPDGTYTSCLVCHAGGVPTTKDCATCHVGADPPHSEVGHASNENCLLSCHSAQLPATHAAEVTALSVGCRGCHGSGYEDVIASWDGACDACHESITHSSADVAHVGVNTGTGDKGCAWTGRSDCHNVSNVATLHQGAIHGRSGCWVCHEAGTPAPTACNSAGCHATDGINGILHRTHTYNTYMLLDQADALPGQYYWYEPAYSGNYPPHAWDWGKKNGGPSCSGRPGGCHASTNPDYPLRAPVVPLDGAMWFSGWSPRYRAGAFQAFGRIDSRLTLNTTVPSSGGYLDFDVQYETELTTDTARVEVSSDNGATWSPIPGTVGGVFATSITGQSGGWTHAHYDLSGFPGARVRFRYTTDDYVFYAGVAIDNLVLGGSSGVILSNDGSPSPQLTGSGNNGVWYWYYPQPDNPNNGWFQVQQSGWYSVTRQQPYAEADGPN